MTSKNKHKQQQQAAPERAPLERRSLVAGLSALRPRIAPLQLSRLVQLSAGCHQTCKHHSVTDAVNNNTRSQITEQINDQRSTSRTNPINEAMKTNEITNQ